MYLNTFKIVSLTVLLSLLYNTASAYQKCAYINNQVNLKYCFSPGSKNYNVDLDKLYDVGPIDELTNQIMNTSTLTADGCYNISTNSSAKLDTFVVEAILSLRRYETEVTATCASNIGTYLCSSMIRYDYPNASKFDVQTCNSLYYVKDGVYSCPQNMTLQIETDSDPIKYVPFPSTLAVCQSSPEIGPSGTVFAQTGVELPLNEDGSKWKWTGPLAKPVDLYPGGLVQGTILGFGVLLAILLVIASLGFIMKQQQKK